MFAEARSSHQEFCVPICVLPATISNNVPGTDLSLGSDTSLNVIVEVRTLSPRGRFRRPPQGPAAGDPEGLSLALAGKLRGPGQAGSGARSTTGSSPPVPSEAPARLHVAFGPSQRACGRPRGGRAWARAVGGQRAPRCCGGAAEANPCCPGAGTWWPCAWASTCLAASPRQWGVSPPQRDGAQQAPRQQRGPRAGRAAQVQRQVCGVHSEVDAVLGRASRRPARPLWCCWRGAGLGPELGRRGHC